MDKLAKTLQELAQQIGMQASELGPRLVEQVRLRACLNLWVSLGILLAAIGAGIIWVRPMILKAMSQDATDGEEVRGVASGAALVMVLAISIDAVIANAINGIPTIMDPLAATLHKILVK